MKNLILLCLIAFCGTVNAGNELLIIGKCVNGEDKFTSLVVIDNLTGDTLQSSKVKKHYRLKPLSASGEYTVHFQNGSEHKTLYVRDCANAEDEAYNYYYSFLTDWDLTEPGQNSLASVDFNTLSAQFEFRHLGSEPIESLVPEVSTDFQLKYIFDEEYIFRTAVYTDGTEKVLGSFEIFSHTEGESSYICECYYSPGTNCTFVFLADGSTVIEEVDNKYYKYTNTVTVN